MPIEAKEIAEKFEQVGGTKIGNLTMGNYRPGGMCKGVCLDWIRRIMNGKPVVYKEGAYENNPEKKEKRLAKMNSTHDIVNRVIRDKQAALEKLHSEAQSLQTTIAMKSVLGSLMFWQPDTAELKKTQTENLDLVDGVGGQIVDKGAIAANWIEFHATWKHEVRSGKTGGYKLAQFNNIRVQGGKSTEVQSAKGWQDYFHDRLAALNPDRCVMLNASFKEGRGHAFGVHSNNTGTLDLYDPNFGMFNFVQPDMFAAALEYMFLKVYPSYHLTPYKADWLIFYPKGQQP
jgi:hypothetical protein